MNRAVVVMGVSLGFWLAASESEQYTTLFTFGVRPLDLIALILLTMGIAFLVVSALLRKCSSNKAVFIVLATLTIFQLLGSLGQILSSFQISCLLSHYYVISLLTKASYVAFALQAYLSARLWGTESISCYFVCFATCASIQLLCALLILPVASFIIPFLPLGALLLWILGLKHPSNIKGNVLGEQLSPHSFSSFPVFFRTSKNTQVIVISVFISIFLLGALLIGTYSNRMTVASKASINLLVQITSGLSGIIASLILLFLHARIKDQQIVPLFSCLIVPPCILLVLYIAKCFSGLGMLILAVSLHRICYLLVFYYIWFVSTLLLGSHKTHVPFLGTFYILRLGWGFGVTCFLTLPSLGIPLVFDLVSLFCVLILVGINTYLFYKAVPSFSRLPSSQESDATSLHQALSRQFSLTPRELEVLDCLARGRTAAYIKEHLYISEGTVRTHINHIYRKVGVKNQQELIDVIESFRK